jgi:hypothetical protein
VAARGARTAANEAADRRLLGDRRRIGLGPPPLFSGSAFGATCHAREHAMIEVQTLDVRIPAEIIHNWGWFLAFGIGLALLGILAIVRSVAATVVSMLFFGCRH